MPPMRLTIPENLPIAAYQTILQTALQQHPVIIVCGDTGSGKTTQLPKMAALARPAARGLIGITQPRRLAAVAMARRLADEVGSPIGDIVGYQHRFERNVSKNTRFKFMTDGVLLAETQDDPLFRRYSTLIIDEAHERSLNIDFLLGLLKRIQPRRPDLRIIVSSATLDAARFAEFFGGAPVISVPGRLYPIETLWMGESEEDETEEESLPRRVANAVDAAGTDSGDILVFLPGEREIRDTMAVLQGRNLPRTEILPLLASLPPGEQARVFKPSACRRIVLATNVAETSVTIPGIRVVIDSGLARIKRYSPQRHVQTLRIEPISQASARQRMGRCGRVGPGLCIRLYSEADYARREAHTPPEIKRTALAGVILTMAHLRLGAIERFPFLEPPTGAAIREGLRELLELGAIARAVPAANTAEPPAEQTPRLTEIGRALAAFPLEPRFARILLAAEAEQSLRDALTVVAAMACDEPLLRPLEKTAQADQQHARFRCANSDFNGRLKLWAWWHDPSQGTSETQRRKRCKAAFVSYPKMREWANIRTQLEELCRSRGLHTEAARGGEGGLHRALLCGLLSRIGHYDSEARDYRGAFAIRFSLFPGSALAKRQERPPNAERPRKPPRGEDRLPESREWVLAGELVETSRLFGRMAACIDPRWIEPIAGALCKVHRHSAFWDAERGFVRVHEDVLLFGLPLVSGRLRDLSRLDPAAARRFFIADALMVPGAIRNPPVWLRTNWQRQQLLEQMVALRREGRDALHDALLTFYEERLPQTICNAPALKQCPPLPLEGEAFQVEAASLRDFPETITVCGHAFPLVYSHAPGAPDDGVTLEATPETLHLLADWHGEWLVPGLLPEKVLWLLNAQPSRIRHVIGSLPEAQSLFLSRAKPYARGLEETLFRVLYEEKGVRADESLWAEDRLPAHLRMNFRVVRKDGSVLGQGRLLKPLIELFAENQTQKPKAASLDDPALARLANRQECLEKLRLLGGNRWAAYAQLPALPANVKAFVRTAGIDMVRLGRDLFTRTLEETFLNTPDDPTDEAALQARYAARKGRVAQEAAELRRQLLFILSETARLETQIQQATGVYPDTQEGLLDQLAWLVFDGFIAVTPQSWLNAYPAFLRGAAERLERARNNPAGDRRKAETVQRHWARYEAFVSQAKKSRHNPVALAAYRWAVECFRLSTFAPGVPPPERYSEKQLDALWAQAMEPR